MLWSTTLQSAMCKSKQRMPCTCFRSSIPFNRITSGCFPHITKSCNIPSVMQLFPALLVANQLLKSSTCISPMVLLISIPSFCILYFGLHPQLVFCNYFLLCRYFLNEPALHHLHHRPSLFLCSLLISSYSLLCLWTHLALFYRVNHLQSLRPSHHLSTSSFRRVY